MNIEYVIFLSTTVTFLITIYILPRLVKKMVNSDICGVDVNKISKPKIPEMGGMAGVLGFTLGTTFVLGIIKFYSYIDETPVLVSISVICIASLIGLLDDISILGRKEKAWFISLAALPLIISQIGSENVNLLFFSLNFENYNLLYWLFLVPFGVTCCANALNMSAGYNGLESGQFVIISFTLLILAILDGVSLSIVIIYSSVFGSCLALFHYNKYPSKIFLGDIATLGFGSLIAACVVMSGHIFYGVICITPTFYELYSTIKYKIKGIERRDACMNPILLENGIIKPSEGSEDYTLAFLLLSYKDLNERQLTNLILMIYSFFSFVAIILFYLFN